MRQFFKTLLASCLGVILAIGVIILILIGVFSRMADKASQPPTLEANSILHIKFDEPIPERTNNLEMNPFDFEDQRTLGLQDIVRTIKHAGADDEIRGIFMELQGARYGQATMKSLFDALKDFKEEGKFVVSYGDYFQQGSYYLSSVSDQIYLNPMGDFNFWGFSAIIPFFKNMLDKIGVEMQVFYAGQFKSATEPYRFTEMSEANRLQVREFLEDLFGNYLDDIAQQRSLPVSELRDISDNFKIRKPADAKTYGLVDEIGYKDQAFDWMRNKIGFDKKEELSFVDLEDYYLVSKERTNFRLKDKVAVIYAEGNIVMGNSEAGTIGDQDYMKLIQDVRKDEEVKAVVLRVNSPGGSALASENIWRELQLIKEGHIPLVVSMGDYAASGGYYIACLADTVLANPNTLTGSIGVFNLMPRADELLNDHLGITFDTVKTGKHSTSLTPFYPLSQTEQDWLQTSVDSIYEHFLFRVSEGRGMTRDQVHEVAQGRVWTGEKAAQIGLVDLIGDLDQAIEIAGNLAGLETYRVSEYPEIKEPFQEFIDDFTGQKTSVQQNLMKQQMGDFYPYFNEMKALSQLKGPQTRLPFLLLPQ